jgi:putative membrane-bound dehydrogenase-like protein
MPAKLSLTGPVVGGILLIAAILAPLGGAARGAPAVVEAGPQPPERQQEAFRLPPGFTIQLVASEPLIQKPMNMAFDTRGRLWVTHSVEYPWAAAAGQTPRDGLTVLEDFGPDGRARKATRFADGLNIPIGVLPLCAGNAAIVWSIPHIWKLSDDDDDGRADRREILYGPFAFEDTHGNQNSFRLGADGWVYANHGFKNASRVKLRGEGPVVLEMKSGNGYRFRPDGSAIEQISWGQVNPFGMDFDALGNRFNADCHTKPLTMLLRGGRYGSPFGTRNDDYDDGLGPAPETTADTHGSTGIAAVAICDTERMPADFQGAAFVGNVVTNVVHRDPIAWRGSSPWVDKAQEFLACDDEWFRPVDLAFGPDGCLYIADFYNCIIGHYEVDLKHPRRDRERGRIWRVAWQPALQSLAAQDLPGLADEPLAALLDSRDETVRRLAFEQLVERGRADASVTALLRVSGAGEHRRARSLRALARLGQLSAADVAAARTDPARLVRVQLMRAVEAWPDDEQARTATLIGGLADSDPFVRRAAAEALGVRCPLADVPAMLAALRAAPAEDAQLVHALRMATAAAVKLASAEALAALPLDEATRPLMLEIVSGLPGREPAAYGLGLIAAGGPTPRALERICGQVARFGDPAAIDAAVTLARGTCGADLERSATVVQAMIEGTRQAGRPLSEAGSLASWAAWLLDAVALRSPERRPDDTTLRTAIAAAKSLALPAGLPLALAAIADAARPVPLRGEAVAVAVSLDAERSVAAVAGRLADPSEPPAARLEFARRLSGTALPSARAAVAAALAVAPAAEQRELALAAMTGQEGAEAVLALVEQGKISARLLQDREVARRLETAGVPDATGRISGLTAGLPAADKRVRELIERVAARVERGEGSAAAGAHVFTKNCAACHRYGNAGGLVGPQLDGVGQRGTGRLLEDILDPNRNVDAAFRTTVLTLADGRAVTGLMVRDDGREHVLVDATGREFRVPRAEVEEMAVLPYSPMPANMADQIGEDGLPDLLAYLRGVGGHNASVPP